MSLAYDERGQLEIGRFLYQQLFASLDARKKRRLRDADEVALRVVTSEEHIARLPWVLLADEGIFLSTVGWSVAVSGKPESRNIELPPSPRILVIAPEPAGVAKTQGEQGQV